MTRLLARVVVVVMTVLASACGGGDAEPVTKATVPDGIVPAEVATGALKIVPYDDAEVEEAFNPKGTTSLVDDGEVWQVRSDALLVGALQVVALAPRADPSNPDDLRSMVSQAIAGSPDRFDIEGVQVFAGRTGERELYTWFSSRLMVYLQLRVGGAGSARFDGEAVVADLIRHQVTHDAWESLPPLTEEDEL
jgi:hypothetical protein